MNCSSFISDSLLKKCRLPTLQSGFGNATKGCLWSCSEVAYFCEKSVKFQDDWNAFRDVLETYLDVYGLILPGVVSNCLLFLTLLSPRLSGTTFLFLRIIGLIQAFEGVLAFLIRRPEIWGQYAYLVGATISKASMNATKLMVCCLSFFLTLDRFLAVCTLAHVNSRKFLIVSVLVSFAISCLEIESLTENKVITVQFNVSGSQPHLAWEPNAWGQLKFYSNCIAYAIMAIRLVILVSMIVFGTAIIFKLRQRGRQVGNMLGSEAAKLEYREMLSLCRFQMVDTIVMALDVFVSLSVNMPYIVASNVIDPCSYSGKLRNFYMETSRTCFYYVSLMLQSFAHGELFLTYLIFFAKFRRAVAWNFKTVFLKGKGIVKKFKAWSLGGQSVSIVQVAPVSHH